MRTVRLVRTGVLSSILLFVQVAGVSAHHSTAEFNYGDTITLTGLVKEVQWTNPHSYVQVLVSRTDGEGYDQWGIEFGAPAINVKMGWRKDSLKVGDEITLHIAPARNGKNYGTLRYLTLPDGRRLDGIANRVKADKDGNPSFRQD